MVMVYVPPGMFMMGSEEGDESAFNNEFPAHEVMLRAFWIDQTEMTNVQFAAFLNVMGNQPEGGVTWLRSASSRVLIVYNGEVYQPKSGFADHPVIEVSWYGAAAYCEWVGGRLPTEAEWEYAARGTDGRIYPWGDEEPHNTLLNYNNNISQTTTVGSYPNGTSPFEVLDMAGNVWEWVSDRYGGYSSTAVENPEGADSGAAKVVRGGSWFNSAANVRVAARNSLLPDVRINSVGFRCAGGPGILVLGFYLVFFCFCWPFLPWFYVIRGRAG
jgi:serine/threonine-protein kinase